MVEVKARPTEGTKVSEAVAAMLYDSIAEVAAMRELCARDPSRDFTRCRKISLERLLAILVTWAEDTIGGELLDFFGWDGDAPTASALVQQWRKLSDEAMPALLRAFLRRAAVLPYLGGYRLLAADGTGIRVPETGEEATRVRSNQGASAHDELHPTMVYDPVRHTFEDVVFQGAGDQNEPAALCELVDRTYPGRAEGELLRALWLADRNYCTFNVLCHMVEAGASFVLRAKDEWVERFLGYVPEGEFDVCATRILTRSRSERGRSRPRDGHLYRVVRRSPLDVLAPGSQGEYPLALRIVRIAISPADDGDPSPDGGGRWLNLVTDLPRAEFPPELLGNTYKIRWKEEIAYLHLKHVVGMRDPRTRDYARLCQEVMGRLILFDACALGIAGVEKPKPGPRHERAIDATTALKAMMVLIRTGEADVEAVAARHTHAVERGRTAARKRRSRRPPRFKYRCC